MNDKLNILFLSRWFPFPVDNGSKIRIYNLIKHLAARHTVDLISFTSEPVRKENVNGMGEFVRRIDTTVYRQFQPTRWKSMLGLFSSKPRSVIDTYSRDMENLVEAAIRRSKYDVLVASQIDMAPYAINVPHTPKILEELELTTLNEYRNKPAWMLEKMRRNLMWKKWKNYVKKTINQFQGVTVVSHNERDMVRRFARQGLEVCIVANGVDVAAHSGDYGSPRPNTLVYSGSLSYRPNFDAIDYFLREIYPLVLSRRPEIDLYITGKLKDVPVHQLPEYSGVRLTGFLDDVRPLIAQSWVNIVPLRTGGGTRLKVLESLALGTPVVSTSKGVEGLSLTAGEHFMKADTPEEFAESVLKLLEKKEIRDEFSKKGRKAVAGLYDWNNIGPSFADFVEEIASYRLKK
jgi:polysaccharide biosynthesis protein PslH